MINFRYFVVFLVIISGCKKLPDDPVKTVEEHPNIPSNIVELYKTRLNQAQLEYDADKIELEHSLSELKKAEELRTTGSVSETLLREARAKARRAKFNVEYSDLAIRESQVQLEIMKIALKENAINWIVSPDFDQRQRRSR